jgi:hypothetical protein
VSLLDEPCRHRPGVVNAFCDRCDALVLAGVMLGGTCGHERLFPPEWTWAPRSWCPTCETIASFGERPRPSLVRPTTPAPFVSPFWTREFKVRDDRPLSLHDLGRVLGSPSAYALARRAGMRWPRSLYRWRSYGLTAVLVDTLAINCCLHPIEVWGSAWEAA